MFVQNVYYKSAYARYCYNYHFCLQLTFQNKAKTEKADERFKSVQDMVVATKSIPGKKKPEKVFIFGLYIVRLILDLQYISKHIKAGCQPKRYSKCSHLVPDLFCFIMRETSCCLFLTIVKLRLLKH